jgi:hypothetical protein
MGRTRCGPPCRSQTLAAPSRRLQFFLSEVSTLTGPSFVIQSASFAKAVDVGRLETVPALLLETDTLTTSCFSK